MDLIDRTKLLKDYTQTFVVGHGVESAKTFQGVVKQVQRVDAVPLSIISDIKAEIMEQFEGCDICRWEEDYDYEENNISEYMFIDSICSILKIIDEKVKEYNTQ